MNGTHQCDSHKFYGALGSNKQGTTRCRRNQVGLRLLNPAVSLEMGKGHENVKGVEFVAAVGKQDNKCTNQIRIDTWGSWIKTKGLEDACFELKPEKLAKAPQVSTWRKLDPSKVHGLSLFAKQQYYCFYKAVFNKFSKHTFEEKWTC